jgi:hypothetical protein
MALSTINATRFTQEQVQRIPIKRLEQASVFLAARRRIFASLPRASSGSRSSSA